MQDQIEVQPKPGDTIAVWFSCGAASAVAAKETLRRYGSFCHVRVVNNPVAEEDPDNRRFLADTEKWLGVPIELAINPRFPKCSAVEVWDKKQYMAGVAGAPCTRELKKRARQLWEADNVVDWHVLGFTAEEANRHKRFTLTERKNVIPVLINASLTKQDCYDVLVCAGISPPKIYSQGYPNANCIGCVKATSPTYWNHVRKHHPEVFAERSEQSARIGARLVQHKGERIFLADLDPEARGRPLRSMDIDCGIFCEEREEF